MSNCGCKAKSEGILAMQLLGGYQLRYALDHETVRRHGERPEGASGRIQDGGVWCSWEEAVRTVSGPDIDGARSTSGSGC